MSDIFTRKCLYLSTEDTLNDLKVERATLPLDNRCPEGTKVNERERERWWWRDKRQNNLAKGGERNVEEKTIGEGMQGREKKRQPQGVLLTLDLMDNSSSMHLVCLCAYACSM